jgi:hypothetical protein
LFKFFRGLALAACLSLSASLIVPASAQTGAETAAELDQLGRWMDHIKPIANEMFSVLDPIDEADAILLRYVEAEIEYDEARTQIGEAKEHVLLIGDDLRDQIAAIPPFPNLAYIHNPRIASSADDLATMVDTLENTAISQIEVYASAVEGDDQAVEMLQGLSFDRAIASIRITNQILAADINSIADLNHPQRSVLNAAYASNEIVILFLEIEKGRQFDFSSSVEKAALKKVQDLVLEIRKTSQKGKRDQASTTARLKAAQTMARGVDKAVLKRVGLMMQEYSKAWPVELQVAEAWEDLAKFYQAAAPGDDTVERYAAAFDKVAVLETERQKLLFERAALMKQ